MNSDELPTFTVAAVQAAPVFLDCQATLAKLERLVGEAAAHGAELVVFGEAFVAGFPIWGPVLPPVDQHEFHQRLFQSAMTVPGPEATRLGEIAAANNVVLSVGVNERAEHSLGQVFNSNLIFDRTGTLVNHRRKLVGTWHERMTWSHGDGFNLEPVDLGGWKVGALICGENTNTLARYCLLAQGERVHIASFPPSWPFDQRAGAQEYDLTESIRLRTSAHSFEGKVFTVVAATAQDEDSISQVANGNARVEAMLRSTPTASLVIGPRGDVLAGPLVREEGIVYATVDLAEEITLKRAHDIVGTYNRYDVFEVRMNKKRHQPVYIETSDDDWASPTSAEAASGPKASQDRDNGTLANGGPVPLSPGGVHVSAEGRAD